MSNRYYDYITRLMLNFFDNNGIRFGDRYSIYLDQQEDIDDLVNALKNNTDYSVQPFSYQLNDHEEFEMFGIYIEPTLLLVSSTSDKVTPDFLVKLRNEVSNQTGDFEKTALITIVSKNLESIESATGNLEKEGMPLHPNKLSELLRGEIEKSNLKETEKLILTDALNKLMKDRKFEQIDFFDFASIFTTLQNGMIEDKDYTAFGMFKDADLETYSKDSQLKRIQLNKNLFEKVKEVHDLGLSKDELERSFSPEGATSLSKEDWQEKDLTEVIKYHEDYNSAQKEQKVLLKEIKVQDGLKYWHKLQNEDTSAGRRKNHIIIFNNGLEKVSLRASFTLEGKDRSLKKDYCKTTGNSAMFDVTVKQTNIDIHIDTTGKIAPKAKIQYKHNNRAALSAELYIIVVPFPEKVLKNFKTRYLVHQTKGIELQYDDGVPLILNESLLDKSVEITEPKMEVSLEAEESIRLDIFPESLNDKNEVSVTILYDDKRIPFMFKNEIYTQGTPPIDIRRINKLVRESNTSMEWNIINDRLHHGNDEYNIHSSTRRFFEWEKEWIERGFLAANLLEEELLEESVIEVSEQLLEAYHNYLKYFKMRSTENAIPSLNVIDEELRMLSLTYVEQYCREIESFTESGPAGKKGVDLFKLGTVSSNKGIYLTPFHPLLVAFKLMFYEELGDEKLPYHILDSLNAEALIPFLYDNQDRIYKPTSIDDIYDWLLLKQIKDISLESDSNNYQANLVKDKIGQFKKHFSYLFIEPSNAPLLINVVNISDEKEVLKGIIEWMIAEFEESGFQTNSTVELSVYTHQKGESFVSSFANIDSVDEFNNKFNLSLKLQNFEARDVFNFIRNNLIIYEKGHDEPIRYAHISFYNMHVTKEHALRRMTDQPTGIAIKGLSSSVPFTRTETSYISGFGLREYSNYKNNYLLKLSYYMNELSINIKNDGNNNYRKAESIYSSISNANITKLEEIYKASHWVTFIDPHFDLDFFNDHSELIVIHYSDQYTSSNKYDAITVTNKVTQYYNVIKEFLHEKNLEVDESNVHSAIKAFNTFNGEWLLRIIGSKGHYDREKLSIISAIKYSLSYFDHPNIIWVPISMEEVLRVGGVLGLNKSDGIFTSKNLNIRGSLSDDLLLIGLDMSQEVLKMYFYPVEVKIGQVTNQTINKGVEQVLNIKDVIVKHLSGENEHTFKGKFYRNFFTQLFLINARKMAQNKIWTEKNYEIDDVIVERLLEDDFKVSGQLEQYIGEGAVITFRKDAFHRGTDTKSDVLVVKFTEEDGYRGILKDAKEINEWLHERENDFIKEDMITYRYETKLSAQEEIATTSERETNSKTTGNEKHSRGLESIQKSDHKHEIVLEETPLTLTKLSEERDIENVRIKIGKIENSEKEVYWEYGHKELANRHLLITGKSGQGKTYFMQCLLLEKAKQGLSSIVIDYTDGFLPDQLEPEFKEYLGDKLVQKIVIQENLPLNPFQRNVQDIGGIEIEESNIAVAERVKSIFSAVYPSLGIQQLNSIYEAVKIGLDKYKEKMSLNHLRVLLEQSDSSNAKTALSQIRPLIDRDPFNYSENFDWGKILNADGQVYIIQLLALPRDVQLILTEFILWDLWNYSVKYGNKNNPIPVVMDESQNLDHSDGSPSERILTEGRKHGWSAWYATQFLRSQLSGAELSRLQMSSLKVYFSPPEEELKSISSTFSNDRDERMYWESKLLNLKKGQCIVHGNVRKYDGTLSPQKLFTVNVSPLSDRL